MYEDIITQINNSQYEYALELITAAKASLSTYDDTFAVLEAEVCYQLGDKSGMFDAISNGLRYNPQNYELFFSLGNYYADTNPSQAYLCYEQAEFYCTNTVDLTFISNAKQAFISAGVRVPGLSIVILSYNACEEMKMCLESLKKNTPRSYEIVIIDNASSDTAVIDYLKSQDGITLVCNQKNVGFPAGCNQGIRLSRPDNDIFLLNNDTIIFPNSIFWLRMGLYENKSVGATGSISNFIYSSQLPSSDYSVEESSAHIREINIPMRLPYEKKLRLIGFALMVKRCALDTIGLLDERFSPGYYEDDDLCFRLFTNDYQLLLCKNSFIYHFGGKSFSRNESASQRLLYQNRVKFNQKWNTKDYFYYNEKRRELASFISADTNASLNILEIGTGMGATLGYIHSCYPSSHVYGIEANPIMASYAKHYIPDIIQGNIETMTLNCYPNDFFDYILFSDVLNQLYDPEATLIKVKKYLKPNGSIIASIPNMMHYSVLLDLLKGNFKYTDAGILDKDNIRFFTLNEIHALFSCCGFHIANINATLYKFPPSEEEQALYDSLLQLPGVAPEEQFNVYQYILRAELR